MSEWAWVTLGFGITYTAMGGYLLMLRHRAAIVRARLEQLR